jgi:hypothetical protein
MRVFIYMLIEQSTGYVIYVGQTRRHPEHRAREHRRDWRRSGIEARFCVLQEVPPGESPVGHERWWIRELERRGHRFLTNVRLREAHRTA